MVFRGNLGVLEKLVVIFPWGCQISSPAADVNNPFTYGGLLADCEVCLSHLDALSPQ